MGNRILAASHNGGVSIFDENLNIMGRVASDFAEAAALTDRGYIVIADGLSGVRVSRDDGSEAMLFQDSGQAYEVVSIGNQSFAATESGIFVIDFSGDVPSALGTVSFEGCRSITGDSNLLLAGGTGGLKAYVPLDGELPVEVSSVTIPDTRSLALSGDMAAILGGSDAVLLDFSNRATPLEIGRISAKDSESLELDNRYLYVSAGYRGLQIYDIRRPSSPKMVSACVDVFAVDTMIRGDTAYVVDGDNLKKVSIFIPEWLR